MIQITQVGRRVCVKTETGNTENPVIEQTIWFSDSKKASRFASDFQSSFNKRKRAVAFRFYSIGALAGMDLKHNYKPINQNINL